MRKIMQEKNFIFSNISIVSNYFLSYDLLDIIYFMEVIKMDNENDFNFSNDNTFRKSSYRHSSNGFGKTIFLPFLSGVVGATLVIGTCFSVPSIKNKIIGTPSFRNITSTSAGTSTESPLDLINISEYSNTSIAVAKKVLPSVVGITVDIK